MTQQDVPRTPGRAPRLLAAALAELVVLAVAIGPIVGQSWWTGFRNYFPLDQLSYAGIATNVSVGTWSFVEPHTLTGTSHYPSAWYVLIGAISGLTHVPVWVVWPILGVVILSAGVLVVGATAARISGRAWVTILPALALLTGTLGSYVNGSWFTPLHEHAVIWGPFGTAFVLNAEVAGLSIAAIALSLLVRAAHEPENPSNGKRILIAAALIGATANIHTYSFFTATFVAAVLIAARELLAHPQRTKTVATIVAPAVVLVAGPVIASVIGPLPLFALLLLAMSPALVPAARRRTTTAVIATAAFVITASPQVIRTALGLVQHDPFLTYREVSTRNLGVGGVTAVIAASTWILAFIACAIAIRGRRQPALAALVIALAVGFVVLPTNDVWGFNQEPYRFWLQFGMLSALLVTIPLAWAFAHWRSTPGPRRVGLTIALGLMTTTWALGLVDVVGFWHYAQSVGVIPLQDARSDAIRALTATHPGLTMPGQCMDPRAVKLITKGAVAEYNLGLAWPDDEPAFRIFHDTARRAGEDPTALQAAKVQWVVTDSACATDWTFPSDQRVIPVAKERYAGSDGTPQTLTLWRVNPS